MTGNDVNPQKPDFYTTKDVARKAGVSEQYIRQLLQRGKQLVGVKAGRDWVIAPEVAERWLEERERKQQQK